MLETTLFVPNAIVFLYDQTNEDVQIPEYIDDTLIAANEECISIGTQADVDGEVTLKLLKHLSDIDKNRLKNIFNGDIDTPGKNISLSTSSDDGVLEMNVKDMRTQVSIWVDDLDFPSLIMIECTEKVFT